MLLLRDARGRQQHHLMTPWSSFNNSLSKALFLCVEFCIYTVAPCR